MLLNLIFSIIIWGLFDSGINEYQFTAEYNKLDFCHLRIGMDGLSLYFVLLTTFIMPICIASSWDNIRINIKNYYLCCLILESLLIIVFIVLDILLFYIFFESVLIPLFFIVGVWGASEAKVRAAFLLFLYTLTAALGCSSVKEPNSGEALKL